MRAEIDLLQLRSGCRLLAERSKHEGHQYRTYTENLFEFLGVQLLSPGFFWGRERSIIFWDEKFWDVKVGTK